MPEWTAEVISWVCGAGGVGLILGWLVGRFGGGPLLFAVADTPNKDTLGWDPWEDF